MVVRVIDIDRMAVLDGIEGEPGDEQDEEAGAGVFSQAPVAFHPGTGYGDTALFFCPGAPPWGGGDGYIRKPLGRA